jgi:hypothetical protein
MKTVKELREAVRYECTPLIPREKHDALIDALIAGVKEEIFTKIEASRCRMVKEGRFASTGALEEILDDLRKS